MADHIVTTDRTPNGKWRWIHNAAPWQCVALRLNIDPDLLGIDEDGWVGKDHILNESQEFHDLLAAAEDAVLSGDLRPQSNGPPRYCTVSIREFMAWEAENKLEAPPELLAMADNHTSGEKRAAGELSAGLEKLSNTPFNIFKTMDGLKWSDITITFTERNAVRISANDRNETYSYDAMGFRNRKSFVAKPNQCWETFRCLAAVSISTKTWDEIAGTVSRGTFKKRISQLRGQLQEFFGIRDAPIAYKKGVGYEAAFTLQGEAHALQHYPDDDEDYQSEMSEATYT